MNENNIAQKNEKKVKIWQKLRKDKTKKTKLLNYS